MREQSHEISTRFEQGDQFPIRLRGGIGNSTLTTILTDLQTDHTLGNEKSIGAISRFLGCFEPISSQSTNQPESLWDQTATAVMAYRHLPQEDQEQINGMMDTLLWSLANTPQERNVHGQIKDISPHVRDLATTIGLTTDTWSHITEPTHHAKQNKLHPKLAIAGALTAASLIASCTPARPTITPEITRPAITQPTQTTETLTPTATITATPTEIPTPVWAPSSEFLAQFETTAYRFNDNQVFFSPDGTNQTQIASIEGGKFVFSVNGQEMRVDPQLATVPEAKWFLNGAADQIMAVNDQTNTYWQYEFDRTTNQWVEKNLPEVSTNIDSPTPVEWNDIVGNRWATAVRRAIEAGKIPTFGPEMVLKGHISEDGGFGNFLGFDDPERAYAVKPEIRPVMYSAYAKIHIGDKTQVILTEQIANTSSGFTLVHIKDIDMLKVNDAITEIGIRRMAPVMTYKTSDICVAHSGSTGPLYCNWFMNGMNEVGQEALDNWNTSGDLQSVVERVLFNIIAPTW